MHVVFTYHLPVLDFRATIRLSFKKIGHDETVKPINVIFLEINEDFIEKKIYEDYSRFLINKEREEYPDILKNH